MYKRLLLLFLVAYSFSVKGQTLVSAELLYTFTQDSLETILSENGIPDILVSPEYDVDYYRIIYRTPYLHPDSMVTASAGLAIPVNYPCGLAIAAYGHGTQTARDRAASLMNGAQYDIGAIFASTGYAVVMPDYLGLGVADPAVPIHPYTHEFSQANTMVNALRATREVASQENVPLNEQIFIYGYSQGGFATVVAVKEIEQNLSDEFQVTASAPMSGAYDLVDAQVDLIASDEVYPTPGYLPYILFAYNSIYGNLYVDPSEGLVSPYDTLLPPLFFEGETSIGAINNMCEPVPRDMIEDSVLTAFMNDVNHPLRQNLEDNHLIGGDWYPTSKMRLLYCMGDDQVTFLNSVNAFDVWTNLGSTQLEAQDLGDFTHNDCAQFAFLNAKFYFDDNREECAVSTENPVANSLDMRSYPNPTADLAYIRIEEWQGGQLNVGLFDMAGRPMANLYAGTPASGTVLPVELGRYPEGVYLVRFTDEDGRLIRVQRLVKVQ